MDLIIGNKVITTPIPDILQEVRRQSGGRYLNYIGRIKNNTVKITCPWHKNGRENHPSCHVYATREDENLFYGVVHCFTCGKAAPLYSLVGHCFDEDDEYGKEWLADNFGDVFDTSTVNDLQPIELNNKKTVQCLDENILQQYNWYHPYMAQRKLSLEVLSKFKVGYDPSSQMITFPVWDEHNNLIMITKRSVDSKRFEIQGGVDKPVYLLNFMLQENQTTLYVCESQINALTLQGWGYPAVALIGTGSKKQYNILNKCGVRNYILCFDGDDAGLKGAERFKKNIRNDVMVSQKIMPYGKDVNDLTKEEFENLSVF